MAEHAALLLALMRAFGLAFCGSSSNAEKRADGKANEAVFPNLSGPPIRVEASHRNLERSSIPLRIDQCGETPNFTAVFHLIAKT